MEIILAPHAGFCFGVEKAVNMVYDELHTGEKISTYGPIIHNEEVVRDLESRGVTVVDDAASSAHAGKGAGTMILRSHGVTKAAEEAIRAKGYKVVDATCPFVKRIHKIVQEAGEAGHEVVIVGDPAHAEVEAIAGWTDAPVHIIKEVAQAGEFRVSKDAEITLVAQTTFNLKKFQEIVAILEQNVYNIHVVNTICNATEVRQTEAEEIATSVDCMIVIGGKGSSNSRKLYEICKENCEKTHFIQTLEDLPADALKGVQTVGITAGASTPKNIIEEVLGYVRTTNF
ncbi:MAG: 4-hydroxy-3-methylbut-2-enyl diphosphate reductase [Lachnospiraceae bacterium]|nr:4-hydroxy-3-methylbut-2-enyl diphosphate reductase [Lachnospiraceae bacterium]